MSAARIARRATMEFVEFLQSPIDPHYRQQHQHRLNMRFTALSVVAFLAGADAFGVSSQQSIRKPAFTSSTAIQGVKNPPANESTPAKALVSEHIHHMLAAFRIHP